MDNLTIPATKLRPLYLQYIINLYFSHTYNVLIDILRLHLGSSDNITFSDVFHIEAVINRDSKSFTREAIIFTPCIINQKVHFFIRVKYYIYSFILYLYNLSQRKGRFKYGNRLTLFLYHLNLLRPKINTVFFGKRLYNLAMHSPHPVKYKLLH